MDSNNNIQSPVGSGHFFSASPHFFDPLPAFLDSHAFPTTTPTTSFSSPITATATAITATAAAAAAGPTRPSRKRSRASRRAPTTVLTTDTSNFRAMVQEFTGIPASTFPTSNFTRFRRFLQSPSAPPAVSFQSLLRSQQPPTGAPAGELHLPGIIGSGGDPMPNNCKIGFPGTATSAADRIHADKASEGLMEPWLCSSD